MPVLSLNPPGFSLEDVSSPSPPLRSLELSSGMCVSPLHGRYGHSGRLHAFRSQNLQILLVALVSCPSCPRSVALLPVSGVSVPSPKELEYETLCLMPHVEAVSEETADEIHEETESATEATDSAREGELATNASASAIAALVVSTESTAGSGMDRGGAGACGT